MVKLDKIYAQSAAAKMIGIKRSTFYSIIKRNVARGISTDARNGIEFSIVLTECGLPLIYIEKKFVKNLQES